jgi:hypothetical protein
VLLPMLWLLLLLRPLVVRLVLTSDFVTAVATKAAAAAAATTATAAAATSQLRLQLSKSLPQPPIVVLVKNDRRTYGVRSQSQQDE